MNVRTRAYFGIGKRSQFSEGNGRARTQQGIGKIVTGILSIVVNAPEACAVYHVVADFAPGEADCKGVPVLDQSH